MIGNKDALRRIALSAVGVVTAGLALATTATSAQAYTDTVVDHYNDSPWFDYDKNSSSPLNSTLTAWVSVNGARHRISMRAGSGNGNTNDCTTNEGWLPNGTYSNNDSDGRSHFTHYNKTSGNSVVRGWVWSLGDKVCHNGSRYRTELFIHSQGTSGWSNSNYASAGCIKINQTDRSHMHEMFAASYDKGDGFLTVQS